jgi:hypothetical protein
VDFHLGGGLNPLRWLGPGDADKALRPMAHFLCLDRWGPPTAAELRNRMPFHVGVRRHGFIRCTSYPDHQAHSWQKISLDSLTANRAAFHFCRMAAPTSADSEGWRSAFRTDVDHDSEVMPISVPN